MSLHCGISYVTKGLVDPNIEAATGDFSPRSHGYRPNRSCQTALVAAVDELDSAPYSWVLKADIKSFFEHIPRSALKHILRDETRSRNSEHWATFIR